MAGVYYKNVSNNENENEYDVFIGYHGVFSESNSSLKEAEEIALYLYSLGLKPFLFNKFCYEADKNIYFQRTGQIARRSKALLIVLKHFDNLKHVTNKNGFSPQTQLFNEIAAFHDAKPDCAFINAVYFGPDDLDLRSFYRNIGINGVTINNTPLIPDNGTSVRFAGPCGVLYAKLQNWLSSCGIYKIEPVIAVNPESFGYSDFALPEYTDNATATSLKIDFLNDLYLRLRSDSREFNLEILDHYLGILTSIKAHYKHLSTAVSQLEVIVNAAKETHKQGQIRVSAFIKQKIEYYQNAISSLASASERIISENDRLLIFSKSSSVEEVLNTDVEKKSSVSVYIAECRQKSPSSFSDAKCFYNGIKQNKFAHFVFVSDATACQYIASGKITKVFIGACSVITDEDGQITEIVNTCGSAEIIDAALRHNIPVFVFYTEDKIVEAKDRDSIFLHDNESIISEENPENGMSYADEKYSFIKRRPNMVFVTNGGTMSTDDYLSYFRKDTWKDARKIANCNMCHSEQKCFVKSCISEEEFKVELAILKYIDGKYPYAARLLSSNAKKASFHLEKISGARLYEIIMLLSELGRRGVAIADALKNGLINECNKHQNCLTLKSGSVLDNFYKTYRDGNPPLAPYPKSKIRDMLHSMIYVHKYILGRTLDYNSVTLENQIDELYSVFEENATVLFRDSTVKNMVLEDIALDGLDQLETPDKYYIALRKLKAIITSPFFAEGNNDEDKVKDYLSKHKIREFDFSSCINLTTKWDDLIGLNLHESVYCTRQLNKVLSKLKRQNRTVEIDDPCTVFITSLIVRYIRFGGRKYLYRYLNPKIHAVRFLYDDENFYFNTLEHICNEVPRNDCLENYSEILSVLRQIGSYPHESMPFDSMEAIYPEDSKNRTPWMGLYKL